MFGGQLAAEVQQLCYEHSCMEVVKNAAGMWCTEVRRAWEVRGRRLECGALLPFATEPPPPLAPDPHPYDAHNCSLSSLQLLEVYGARNSKQLWS